MPPRPAIGLSFAYLGIANVYAAIEADDKETSDRRSYAAAATREWTAKAKVLCNLKHYCTLIARMNHNGVAECRKRLTCKVDVYNRTGSPAKRNGRPS